MPYFVCAYIEDIFHPNEWILNSQGLLRSFHWITMISDWEKLGFEQGI